MKKFLALLTVFFVSVGCQKNHENFSIYYPETFEKTGELSNNAVLQLIDTGNKIYLVVKREEITPALYSDIKNPPVDSAIYYLLDDSFIFPENLKISKEVRGKDTLVTASFKESETGQYFYWKIKIFRTKKGDFYQLWLWSENDDPKTRELLDTIAKSFVPDERTLF